MKKIDVLFFVEHKDREMDGTLEIIKQLRRNDDFTIVVANIEFGFFDAFLKYNPRIVCLPYCRSIKNHLANAFYIKNSNTSFLNLNYEQIFNPTTMLFKRPQDDFAKKQMYHIAWGHQFKKYLIENGVDKDHIYITGKPEIYFLNEMQGDVADLRIKLSLQFMIDREKIWCFLPLNDGTAFIPEEKIKDEIKKGKRLSVSLKSHIIAKKQVELLLFYMYRAIKKDNKKIEFILRPHPGVSIKEYNDLMKKIGIEKCESIHIIKDYTVKEWLSCSDVCISNWSTVILDASTIGLKTFVFQPEILPDCLNAPWIEIFNKIKDYESFIDSICNSDAPSVSNQYICEYIDTRKNPIVEISNVILKILQDEDNSKRVHVFKAFKAEFVYLIRSKLRSMFIKNIFLKEMVNKKLLYDYFKEIVI